MRYNTDILARSHARTNKPGRQEGSKHFSFDEILLRKTYFSFIISSHCLFFSLFLLCDVSLFHLRISSAMNGSFPGFHYKSLGEAAELVFVLFGR